MNRAKGESRWSWRETVAVLAVLGAMVLLFLWSTGYFKIKSATVKTVQQPHKPERLWSVSFSPDSQSVVAGGGEPHVAFPPDPGELILWNIKSGRTRAVWPDGPIRSVAWSPSGKFIATGDFAGETKLVSPDSGKTDMTLGPAALKAVNAVAVSGDGKLIARASFDGTIDVRDKNGKEVQQFDEPEEKFLDVAISRTGESVLASTVSGKVLLFNRASPSNPLVLQSYPGEYQTGRRAECAALTPDGSTFASSSLGVLRLWDAATGALKHDLHSNSRINNMAFSPDGSTVATVHNDGTLQLWDVQTGEVLKSTQAHPKEAFGISFAPDGTRIATVARNDFMIKIWNAKTLENEANLGIEQFK